MIKSKPVEVWVQMAVLAVVISAGAWYAGENAATVRPSPNPPVTGDELPVPVPEHWRTYVDPDKRFSFRYPQEATVVQGAGEGLYIDEPIDFPEVALSVHFPRTDTFSENGSHGYYEARVRFFVGGADFGCNPSASGNDSLVGEAVVAGKKAFVFERSDAGAGNRMFVRRYALCGTDGTVYDIEDVFASGSDGTPLTPKLETDIATLRAHTKSIINSLEVL